MAAPPRSQDKVTSMGKKLPLSQLTTEECETLLKVFQKDFAVRRAEKRKIK